LLILLTNPSPELGEFIKPLDINNSGGIGLGVADPAGEGLVADAHVQRGGPLRLATPGGVADGGELERLGEMSPGIACRPGIGGGDRRSGRKRRAFR